MVKNTTGTGCLYVENFGKNDRIEQQASYNRGWRIGKNDICLEGSIYSTSSNQGLRDSLGNYS